MLRYFTISIKILQSCLLFPKLIFSPSNFIFILSIEIINIMITITHHCWYLQQFPLWIFSVLLSFIQHPKLSLLHFLDFPSGSYFFPFPTNKLCSEPVFSQLTYEWRNIHFLHCPCMEGYLHSSLSLKV